MEDGSPCSAYWQPRAGAMAMAPIAIATSAEADRQTRLGVARPMLLAQSGHFLRLN